MANFAQDMRPSSVCAFHARLFANATQPVVLASIVMIVLLCISLSVGAIEAAISILGALIYALCFKLLPVLRPSAKLEPTASFSASGGQSVKGAGVSASNPNVAQSLFQTQVTKPLVGLDLPQTSVNIVDTCVDPQTPDPAGIRNFACAAQEPCGLQLAKQAGPNAEMEWGLHLRGTLMALPRTTNMPGKWNATSNQPRNSTKMLPKLFLPLARFEHIPTDDNSLRAILRKLAQVEPERVFMVKKIFQLGLNSGHSLWAHFEQFGTVEQVFVCHAVAKKMLSHKNCSRTRPLFRPGNTGFVVMSTVEEASAALAFGSVQTIEGRSVGVSKYVCRQAELRIDTR